MANRRTFKGLSTLTKWQQAPCDEALRQSFCQELTSWLSEAITTDRVEEETAALQTLRRETWQWSQRLKKSASPFSEDIRRVLEILETCQEEMADAQVRLQATLFDRSVALLEQSEAHLASELREMSLLLRTHSSQRLLPSELGAEWQRKQSETLKVVMTLPKTLTPSVIEFDCPKDLVMHCGDYTYYFEGQKFKSRGLTPSLHDARGVGQAILHLRVDTYQVIASGMERAGASSQVQASVTSHFPDLFKQLAPWLTHEGLPSIAQETFCHPFGDRVALRMPENAERTRAFNLRLSQDCQALLVEYLGIMVVVDRDTGRPLSQIPGYEGCRLTAALDLTLPSFPLKDLRLRVTAPYDSLEELIAIEAPWLEEKESLVALAMNPGPWEEE